MLRPILLALSVLAVLLGACDTPATRPSFPDIRFTGEPKLRFDVASIVLVDEFKPTFQAPNVEHLFPVSPQHAVETWVHDRMEAAGTTGRIRVRIIDASVKEVELPRTQGITGAFTRDQAERYDASVSVRIEMLDEHGIPGTYVDAAPERHQSVAEGITPNDRDQVWYDMTKALMTDLDKQLEASLRKIFSYHVQ